MGPSISSLGISVWDGGFNSVLDSARLSATSSLTAGIGRMSPKNDVVSLGWSMIAPFAIGYGLRALPREYTPQAIALKLACGAALGSLSGIGLALHKHVQGKDFMREVVLGAFTGVLSLGLLELGLETLLGEATAPLFRAFVSGACGGFMSSAGSARLEGKSHEEALYCGLLGSLFGASFSSSLTALIHGRKAFCGTVSFESLKEEFFNFAKSLKGEGTLSSVRRFSKTNVSYLRTPEERFENLPGYPFAPHYMDDLPGFEGLRMHYVDEGAKTTGQTFLLLHGEPTWSYLYRKMIPQFSPHGRVIAPDMFGFGKSDKPLDPNFHSFETHRRSLMALIEKLDLQNITLVVQDWGGLLGLTIPMDMASRFKNVIIMNTTLATGEIDYGLGYKAWRAGSGLFKYLPIGRLVQSENPRMSVREVWAYDAPFPERSYKVGPLRLPHLVPDRPEIPGADLARRAVKWWETEWTGQSFMAVGVRDPIIKPHIMDILWQSIRGYPKLLRLERVGHFVQEKAGPLVAEQALAYFFGIGALKSGL